MFQIASLMQIGKNVRMQTWDDAIQDLLTKKWISPEEGMTKPSTKIASPSSSKPRRMSFSSKGLCALTPPNRSAHSKVIYLSKEPRPSGRGFLEEV